MWAYVDTSALVKRYVDEPGRREVQQLLRRHDCVTSAILPVELRSALRRRVAERTLDSWTRARRSSTCAALRALTCRGSIARRLAGQETDMTTVPGGTAERVRSRVDAELPLLAGELRKWVVAHLTPPREIRASLDPEGAQEVVVWLITDHTGTEDSASRIVYEPIADAFGIAIDMRNGAIWFQGSDGSLSEAVENM